jgi:hypothetical protein
MLSSTSNSDDRPHHRKASLSIWAIVAGLVIIGLASEAVTIFGVNRVSKILRRNVQEYRDSEKLRSYSPAGKPTVLLLGNSLLLEGVDYPSMRVAIAQEYDVHRLVFEQTEYLDQYYVLRGLFRDGARPRVVVLCDSVAHFIGDDTRGEYMSKYVDAIDLGSLGRRAHLNATIISGLMLAHWSAWYAYRAETRKAVLALFLPDMGDLATKLGWRPAKPTTAEEVRVRAFPRLKEMKELCDQYGSQLIILVPPSQRQDHADVLVSIGEENGIRVLVPVQPGALDATFFRDGFHLNPAGAAIFTAKLQTELTALGN